MYILDYKILDTIYQSDKSRVILALNEKTMIKVILKTSNNSDHNADDDNRINYEYEITLGLDFDSIPKPLSLSQHNGKSVLVREYIEGESLKFYLKNHTFSLENFLSVASKLTETIGRIHQQNIIHKDINSNNIVYNPQQNNFKLIDFGIASKIDLKNQNLGNPNRLEGTLSYISPEQTGRMNRVVDHRSDFYSLGVTFYEMLSNELPFQYKDPLEIIHAHIAKSPIPLHERKRDIPEVISRIVQKLLSKNAEDRYQSALGLKYDLDQAYRYLLKKLPILPFEIAQKDYSIKFQIPQKLYGREKDIASIVHLFDRISDGMKGLIQIKGYSGVGKTALVSEVHKPLTTKKGLFLEGKFEQFQKNIPYFAWKQVFNKFAELVLSENSDTLEEWKSTILNTLGDSARVLTDLSPQLERVLGKLPDLIELENVESENRFNFVIKNFIQLIAQSEHPVVVFIDDWQWADIPSINLFKNILLDEDIKYLLVISAFRENEVDISHPFSIALEELQKEDALWMDSIALGNLTLHDISNLIADTIGHNHTKTKELAELIYSKTKGNAFFANQLLRSLHEEGYLKQNYDPLTQKMQWDWNMDSIRDINITENVVAFLIEKIKRISSASQSVLQLAACMGTFFDLNTLSVLCEKPQNVIQEDLWEALEDGFIIPLDTNKRHYTQFKFAHDRIRQAFYEMNEEGTRQKTHLQIGKLLSKALEKEEQEKILFDIVNHFNQGSQWIVEENEQKEVALLNLKASQKAQASAAFDSALDYAKSGIQLLSEKGWTNHYQLCFDLHKEAFEDVFLLGNFNEADIWLEKLLSHANNLLDKVNCYEIQINRLKAQNRLPEALQLGLDVMKMLGINIPPKPSMLQIIWQIIKTNQMLSVKKHDKLFKANLTDNPLHITMERLLSNVSPLTYFLAPKLVPILIAKQAQLAIQNGQTIYTAYSYSSYAMIMAGTDNIKFSYALGLLSEKIKHKLNPRKIEGRIKFVLDICVKHWVEPLQNIVEDLRNAYLICMETGDFEFAGLCINIIGSYGYMSGINLKKLDEEQVIYQKVLKEKTNQISKYTDSLIIQNFINYNLENPRPIIMYDEEEVFVEEDFVKNKLLADDNKTNYLTHCYGKFSYFYRNRESSKALYYLDEFERLKDAALGSAFSSEFYLYKALVYLDLYQSSTAKEKRKLWKGIQQAHKKVRFWAKFAPSNYEHKDYLIRAEKYRVLKRKGAAANFYNKAISAAQNANYTNIKAMAEEAAARFYFETGQEPLGVFFLQNAYKSYSQWGCTRKLRNLREIYPQYFNKTKTKSRTLISDSNTILATSSDQGSVLTNLDFLSIVKSSQTISGEIIFANLLEKMMYTVIENAGAERGLLLLPNNDQFYIEAEIDLERNKKSLLTHIPLFQYNNVADNIISYTARTLETIVIANASKDQRFNKHPYIMERDSKSILCMPLLKQGNLIGILYLENNLATDVFIQERTEVLQLLSSQMAISIENALLYENLEQKVKERTEEVVKQKEIIEDKNKNITDSINYAKRIQQAILPKTEDIKNYLPESFIYFKPRDIVSGDFYYFSQKNDKIFIAAVDCTGHGVPGAFMSLIGNDLISQIIEVDKQEDVAEILKSLRDGIKQTLKQEETNNQDGMDISLCMIDQQKKELHFAGSNSLVYFQDNKAYSIKGDKIIIGGFRNYLASQQFTKHVIPLNTTTTFYIFTDGYQDQFGGENGRKFTSPRLREFLKSIHHLPMEEQIVMVHQNLESWMNQSPVIQGQIDDILMIGIRV